MDDYIVVQLVGQTTSGKTNIYKVLSRINNDIKLGEISWHAPWRKYCFYPAFNTVFDAKCLNAIQVYLNQLMSDR